MDESIALPKNHKIAVGLTMEQEKSLDRRVIKSPQVVKSSKILIDEGLF